MPGCLFCKLNSNLKRKKIYILENIQYMLLNSSDNLSTCSCKPIIVRTHTNLEGIVILLLFYMLFYLVQQESSGHGRYLYI